MLHHIYQTLHHVTESKCFIFRLAKHSVSQYLVTNILSGSSSCTNYSMILHLLHANCSPDAPDGYMGVPPIIQEVRRGRINIIIALILYQCNLDVSTQPGSCLDSFRKRPTCAIKESVLLNRHKDITTVLAIAGCSLEPVRKSCNGSISPMQLQMACRKVIRNLVKHPSGIVYLPIPKVLQRFLAYTELLNYLTVSEHQEFVHLNPSLMLPIQQAMLHNLIQ